MLRSLIYGAIAAIVCLLPLGNVSAPGERALAAREEFAFPERLRELDLSESPALQIFRSGGRGESKEDTKEAALEAAEGTDGRIGCDPAELAFLRARAAIASGDTREALSYYLSIDEEHPLRLAAASAIESLQRRPDGERPIVSAPLGPIERRLQRARQLYRSRQYEEARRQARAIAARSRGVIYDNARMLEAESLGRLGRKHEELATLSQLLRRAGDPGIRARALYRMGLAHSVLGRPDAARDHLDALIRSAPGAPEAAEALRLSARASIEALDVAGAILRYEQALESYATAPTAGDIALEYSRFLYSIGEFESAREVLRRADRLRLDRRAEDQRGRFLYFEARLVSMSGERSEASELFSELISRWPLSYYGVLAGARLRELDPAALERVRERLHWRSLRVPREYPSREPDDREYSALESLLRLRLFDEAERFMNEIGLLGAESTRARRAYSARIFRILDEKMRSLRILRRSFDDLEYLRFDEEGLARLRLAYPRDYEGVIEAAAREAGISAALLRAIAREESSFAPRARSRAGARGLVQIMPATGRSLAQRVGIKGYTDELLNEPEINLRLGASYLALLTQRFDGRWPLAPSAYNAGQGNLDRWLARDEAGELDLFIEAIPFDETRRYTRRVIQSYAIYAFLDEGRFIEPPLELRDAPAKPEVHASAQKGDEG